MVKCLIRKLSLFATLLLLVSSVSHASPNNFRFALPESYQPFMMDEHSALLGSVLILTPAEVNEPEQASGNRNIRLLVVKDTPQNLGFSANAQGFRSYAQAVLDGLKVDCQQPNLHVGSLVQLSGGFAVDWRRQCLSAESAPLYLAEQGRLFVSEHGAYGLSQFGLNSNRSTNITERERNWFAKFTFNSSFCLSGTNCGDEGLLTHWVDYQPEAPVTPE